jgi:methyl-accepting chemotaxis protein
MKTMSKIGPLQSAHGGGGIGARWKNLRVKTKILLGFGLVLALFAGVSALGYRSMTTVSHQFDGFVHTTELVGAVRGASQGFTELRRHAREFANLSIEDEAKLARDTAKGVQANIAQGLKLNRDAEGRKRLDDMNSQLDAYMKHFEQVVALRHEHAKLIKETLDPAGSKIREDFEHLATAAARSGDSNVAILANTALLSVMRVRLYVNEVLDRHEQSAMAEVAKHFADLGQVLAALDGATKGAAFRTDFEDAQKLAKDYQAAYKRAEALARELEVLTNEKMKHEAEEIATDVKSIVEAGTAEEHRVKETTDATIDSTELLILILSLAGVSVGLGLAWVIGLAIARPIIGMTAAMARLANRDWTAEVPALGQTDEIGQMAEAVQVFKDNGIENDRMAEAQRAEQAAKEKRQKTVEELIAKFDTQVTGALGALSSASTELNATATTMASTAEETTRQASAVAAASEQTTTNVQTVAAATEEMSSSVGEIGRQVSQSTEIAKRAVAEADKTNAEVQGLADAASKIGEVVNLISDIAEQTNLLALNATIEAARAGEAGKGFAVVASEVKTLASQTAKATEEIATQIGAIQAAVGGSVEAIKGIGKTIAEISEIATTIASAVEEQGAATQEISRNVQEAAKGTQEVSSNIGGVSQAAGETGAAASQVQAASSDVARQGEALKTEVDNFLAGIRAA